jgi:hypothetical protein
VKAKSVGKNQPIWKNLENRPIRITDSVLNGGVR